MTPITFHFTPTAQDYTKTLRAFYASNRLYWFAMLPLVIALLSLLCALPGLFVGGRFGPEIIPPLLLGAFFPALLAFAYTFPLFQISRQVAKNERMRAESTCTLDDEGIMISTRFAETRMDWGTFSKMLETREHFLLIYALNKRCFQIIPKRAFETAEQEAGFRDLVHRHIGQYQDRQKGTPRWLIVGAVILVLVAVTMGTFVVTYTKQLAGTWTAVGSVRVDGGALLVVDPSYLPSPDDDLTVRLDGVAPGEYS